MGFFEKFNKNVRSSSHTTQTVNVEKKEESVTTESEKDNNTNDSHSNIATVVSNLTHFWEQIAKPKLKDSFNSETPDLANQSKEEIITGTTDIPIETEPESFFESMKESLIKGTNKLKDSISLDSAHQESESPLASLDNEAEKLSDTIEKNTSSATHSSYSTLKNFFGESIDKVKETVKNIDNLAASVDSEKSNNETSEDTESTITIEKSNQPKNNNTQTPLTTEVTEQEITKNSSEEPQDSTLNELKNFFNKGVNVIKQSVNQLDSMANSTDLPTNDSKETFESNNQTTDDLKVAQPETNSNQETINNHSAIETKQDIDTLDKNENNLDDSPLNNIKSFFSKSIETLKTSTQSIDMSDSVGSMKALFDKGMDKIKHPDINEPLSSSNTDNINQLDDAQLVKNDSKLIQKKETIEQLITDTVTDTQELAQILDIDKEENHDSPSTEEINPTALDPTKEPATLIERLAEKITSTSNTSNTLEEVKKPISATAAHFMAEKMSTTVAKRTEIDSNLPTIESPKKPEDVLVDTHSDLGRSINLNKPNTRISNQPKQTSPEANNADHDTPEEAIESKLDASPILESTPLIAKKIITDNLENEEKTSSEKIPHAIQEEAFIPSQIDVNLDSTEINKDSSTPTNPDNNSLGNNFSTQKENINADTAALTTSEPSLDKANNSATGTDIPLVKPPLKSTEQITDLSEEIGTPIINEAPLETDSSHDEIHEQKKSRGIYWGLAILLLTLIISGAWWSTFSENNQHSKDTDFVNFESLVQKESRQKPTNQNNQTNNLSIASTETISLPETSPIETLEDTTPIENEANLSDQSIKTEAIVVNSAQTENTAQSIINNTSLEAQTQTLPEATPLINEPIINEKPERLIQPEKSEGLIQLDKSAQNQTNINTNKIDGTIDTQNSILSAPIAKITDFLNSNDGSLPKGFILHGLNFNTASSRISDDSSKIISDLATLLTAHPSIKIRLEGHTDSQGDATKNQRLSARRAQSVKSKLVSLKLNPARIKVAGLGEEFPIMDNESTIGRQNNRRVEVIIVDGWFLNLNNN